MKKYLSLILAVMMVLSCVSYAAPVAVGTVQSANEADVEVSELFEADLAEETETTVTTEKAVNQIVYNFTFDNLAEGDLPHNGDLASKYAATTNLPEGFPALRLSFHPGAKWSIVSESGSTTDKALYAAPTGAAYTRWYLRTGDSSAYPEGIYTISVTNRMTTGTTISFSLNAVEGNVGLGSSKVADKDVTYTNTFELVPGVKIDGKAHTKKIHQFECYTQENATPYYVDNLQLSYKPAFYKVTLVGAQGVPSTVDVVKDGIFVPSEFVCSVPEKNVGSEFLGWSLTDGGEILDDYITISADTTLYAVYSEPTGEQVVETENPKYGKLAYYVDFDVASGTAVPHVSFNSTTGTTSYKQLTTVSLPEIEGMPATVELEAYGSAYKTDGDNLVMVGQNFPRWWFAAYGEDGSSFASFPKGIYTVEYEAKGNVTNKLANVVAVFGNPTVWKNQDWVANVQDKGKFSDSYNVYTVTFTYDGSHVINVAGNKIEGSNSNHLNDFSAGLQKIGLYSGSGANYKNDNRYYKWVKIWYAPETINLSYDANGKNITVPETAQVSSKVNFANLPKLESCGTSRFAGWSETKNGEILTGEKLYGEDVTLYAVWDEHYYPEEGEPDKKYQLINISLNNFSGNNLQSQVFNYTEGGKYTYDGKSSQEIWKVLPGVKEDTMWYLNVGPKGNRNAIYDPFNHPDNAFRIPMTLEANKAVYPKMFISSANMPDGIYTIATEVMLEKNDAITLAEVCMFIGGTASDPFANLVDLSNKQNEKFYYTASMLILDGKAYDAKTFELSDRSAVGANKFGLNFNLKASENTTVYVQIDNFRVYYQPYTGAPKSYKENSIRVVNPAGIRFKASVSDIERTNDSLTEYGFVVTRKILLDNAGIDVNDFTFDSDVVKVPGKSYDKAANIDKIFETNKNETFFTAVVYNIPAQAYKDDIVVRPYVKYGDNYVYGDAMVRNIYDVAVQLKASADADKYGEALDKIINGEEL